MALDKGEWVNGLGQDWSVVLDSVSIFPNLLFVVESFPIVLTVIVLTLLVMWIKK